MTSITPFLWFDSDLAEVVEYYVGIFPDAEVLSLQTDPRGTSFSASFTLAGQRFLALNGGPGHPYSDAVSFFVDCADQAEVDHYWDALTPGGREVACGWLVDRYGVSWQIVPTRLQELLSDPDRGRAQRAMTAMRGMVKLDVAALERAADGLDGAESALG